MYNIKLETVGLYINIKFVIIYEVIGYVTSIKLESEATKHFVNQKFIENIS